MDLALPPHVIIDVWYVDGTFASYELQAKAWIAIEERWPTDRPSQQATYFGAFVMANPDWRSKTFEEWIDTVRFARDRMVDPSTEATLSPEVLPPSQ